MTRCSRALRAVFLLASLAVLSGCSFITNLFPDKQKQYRYSSDIPPLEIPPDLSASSVEGLENRSRAVSATSGTVEDSAPPDTTSESPRSESRKQTPRSKEPRKTSLAQAQDNAPLIEMEAPFAETWNDVSRALGRLEVELTDQNRTDGVFYVYYGDEAHKPKAGESSLWQDIKSAFSSESGHAGEYRVKLEETGDYTNIFVLDSTGKAAEEGPGFELLKRLNDTLRALDQPDSEAEREEK